MSEDLSRYVVTFSGPALESRCVTVEWRDPVGAVAEALAQMRAEGLGAAGWVPINVVRVG